jgi:hypothetical protein
MSTNGNPATPTVVEQFTLQLLDNDQIGLSQSPATLDQKTRMIAMCHMALNAIMQWPLPKQGGPKLALPNGPLPRRR